MTPEEAAYCVRHDCDRRNPVVKRLLDENDRRLTEEHERRLRDDPAYAQQWAENIRRFADDIDAKIATDIYDQIKET